VIARAFLNSCAGDAGPLGHNRRYAGPVRGGALWNALRSAAIFPASDRELLVDLQLPENASIYATRTPPPDWTSC
jgi:hypothetical protein